MGAIFFSNQQNSLYNRINDDSHNFDSIVKRRKRRHTNEEEYKNVPLKNRLYIDNAKVSTINYQQEKRNDKLETISDPVDFNLIPSSHLSKREWSFYKKIKDDIFSKNKPNSKPCSSHMPVVNEVLKNNKTLNVTGQGKVKKRLYKPKNDKLFDTPRSIKSFSLQPYAKIYRINRDMNRDRLTDPNGKMKCFSLESQVSPYNNKKDFYIQNIRNNRSKNESKAIETDNSVTINDTLGYMAVPNGDILPKTNILLDQKFLRNLNISNAIDTKMSSCNFSKPVNDIVLKPHENKRQSLVFNHFNQNKVGLGILKEDVVQNFKNSKCINNKKTRKKRSSFIYDSPDNNYDDDIFEDNQSKDEDQLELGIMPNSLELRPDKALNSKIDLMDSAETADPQENKDGIITKKRKAMPLSTLFIKTYLPSLKNEDLGCNASDIIFPTKVGNTIVFRNPKISPIKSSDKFSYYNGTVISGACLVKKSNYSVSQLTKIPVFLKTPKPSVEVKDSLLQNSSISSGAMSVSCNSTSRKNRTNGFFTKMISYMKSKVSDGEVPTDKCATIKVDKEVYYDIGKDLPLIAKSQDFQFSNGTVINGGALLKKAKYSKSKLKDILLMDYESLHNNKGTNKSYISANASSVLNGIVPFSSLEISTKSMDQERYQNESVLTDSVTISDRNLANTSERIIPDIMSKSSTCDYQGSSVSHPAQSSEETSESAFSQKLPTNMMIGSYNRSSTTSLPLPYSTSHIASISNDKILPVEPDVYKQKAPTKIDKHQQSFFKKLLPVQEAIKNKQSTEIHRVPRTTSLRTLSEPSSTDISKAAFIQITPTPSLKKLGEDRSTQAEQSHSGMSISHFVPTQPLNFNQDRTMQDQLLISTTKQFNPSSERTIPNSVNNASMDDQLRASQNNVLTSLSSLSPEHEEIVTSSIASEGFSELSDDDKNLVTDDKVYTSLADSKIATSDQEESDVGSQATPEDNSNTSSLQIDTPLDTESSSILLSTEPLLENSSPSILSKETEDNIILTSEISDISTSKENLQPKLLDSDKSLSGEQAIQQSYESSTMMGELVKFVDKLIIEHMFSTTDSSNLSTEPESHTIDANVYPSGQPNDMSPCLLDKLHDKDFYLINPAKNNLNDKLSAWRLHHTDQAVPCNMYFLEQSNENDPNPLEHKNRTVYQLDHSGFDYYFCPSHPDQVFLIQRDHENKHFNQQNYLHFVDIDNNNLPVKHFHYMESVDNFHDANLASDNNSSMPDTNFYILDPKDGKTSTYECNHPYCHVHHITPSNEVNSILPSNIESDQYYTLNNENTDNLHVLDQPSEIAIDKTDSLENNNLNSETKEDDHTLSEPKDNTFLETDETRNPFLPCSSEDHNHSVVDPLNKDIYYIVEDKTESPTSSLDHPFLVKYPYKHCCHHHMNNQEGQVNQLSCPNRYCSYHQHSNKNNNVEPLCRSNEEERGPRDDLRPIQNYEINHCNQNQNALNSLRDKMLQNIIQNDSGGSISNQDQIHQLENSNLDIESRQIGPLNENNISQNGPLKDDYSPSDRQQQGASLISMEQQNNNSSRTIKDKDSKESDPHTLRSDDDSIEESNEDNLLPSDKLNDNSLQSDKSNEEENSLQSEKSNKDDILLSERSNQDNFLLSEKTNQDNSPISEKLNEENNLHSDGDNSVHAKNANESSFQPENANKCNSLQNGKSNEESFLLTEKEKEDNSLLTQKINEANPIHSEVPKVVNYIFSGKPDERNLPQSENILSNNAFDNSNPSQNNFQQPEKLNNDNFLQTNKVDSTKNSSLDNTDSGVMRCPYCQRQYMSVQLINTDQCHCQNHHNLNNIQEHSDGHMKQCKNCGNAVPNWYAMSISYSNNKNRIEKHAKNMESVNNEDNLKYNVDENRDLKKIDRNDLISGKSQFLEEKRKIKGNEANESSVSGMICTEMDPKQKNTPKNSSSISLELCSCLNESPIDLLESPFEHHINEMGVIHNNFQGSVEKSEPQGANRDMGRPRYCGKSDLIENSITHITNGKKDSNSYIKKNEPDSISSQSKSSFEIFNKTVNSLVVQKSMDVLSPQNISLTNNVKAKGKNVSLKQIPPITNIEKWETFVLNKNNGTLSHTPLKVPLVLSNDGRTVWTLNDYILEAEKNPLLSQKNAYYYIYDSFTPLGSCKSIKLLNGSTVLQGNLIKEANYSYSAFLGLLNVKADLQLNIDPEVSSKQCIDVILVRQPFPNNNDGSVQAHSSGIFMAEDGKKAKYYTDNKDMYLQDKILHECIFLPTNKTIQPSRNKTNLSNYFHQSQELNNPSILKIISVPDNNNQLKDCSILLIKSCNQRVKNPGIYSPEGIIEHSNLCQSSNTQSYIPIAVYNQECKGTTLLKNKCCGPDDHSQHKNKYDPIEVEDRVFSSC